MDTVQHFSHTPKFEGRASDVVAIPLGGGKKMLMLSGVAAERPDGAWLDASLVSAGTIEGQLEFVWGRIGELLALHGGKFSDIVKVTLYGTESRYLMDPVGTYSQQVFGNGPVPAMTGVVVTALAWPGMLIEIDVTAVVSE